MMSRACDLDPQWRLLKSQLETKGPGWYAEREERLFTNKSNRPGDDMKEALRTDGDTAGLGLLRRTSFGSYANLLHPWCFRANKRFSLTCIPKSGRKNKSFPLHIPAFRKMSL